MLRPLLRTLLPAVLLAGLTTACGGPPTTPWPTAEVGVDLQAQVVRLDPASPTPVVLVFWATWCGHCKTVLAEVGGWQAQRRFDLIAINLREPADRVAQFLAGRAVPGRVVLDLDGAVAAAYDGQPVPTMVVIAGGRVFGRVRGRSRRNSKRLLKLLDDALQWSTR